MAFWFLRRTWVTPVQWRRSVDQVASVARDVFHEIGQRPADDLLERQADKVGKPSIDGANLTFEREREKNVIE
jgi:hypothetical protein